MKIGLISRGRTQSSAIVRTLAKRHNLEDVFEIYFNAHNHILSYQHIKSLGNKKYDKSKDFHKQILVTTDNLFNKENFICKLWPSMLSEPFNIITANDTFYDIKNKTIFNISEYFRIRKYDQLYYINKDLQHSTISWAYTKKTQLFHRFKSKEYLTPMITIDDTDLSLIKFYILEYCLQEKIKDFLNEQQISYTDITETYNQYIDADDLKTTVTDNDYTKLISNYDTLPSFIDDWYKLCIENTSDWKYY
jgi:hypothetical protein